MGKYITYNDDLDLKLEFLGTSDSSISLSDFTTLEITVYTDDYEDIDPQYTLAKGNITEDGIHIDSTIWKTLPIGQICLHIHYSVTDDNYSDGTLDKTTDWHSPYYLGQGTSGSSSGGSSDTSSATAAAWGGITGNINNQSDLTEYIQGKIDGLGDEIDEKASKQQLQTLAADVEDVSGRISDVSTRLQTTVSNFAGQYSHLVDEDTAIKDSIANFANYSWVQNYSYSKATVDQKISDVSVNTDDFVTASAYGAYVADVSSKIQKVEQSCKQYTLDQATQTNDHWATEKTRLDDVSTRLEDVSARLSAADVSIQDIYGKLGDQDTREDISGINSSLSDIYSKIEDTSTRHSNDVSGINSSLSDIQAKNEEQDSSISAIKDEISGNKEAADTSIADAYGRISDVSALAHKVDKYEDYGLIGLYGVLVYGWQATFVNDAESPASGDLALAATISDTLDIKVIWNVNEDGTNGHFQLCGRQDGGDWQALPSQTQNGTTIYFDGYSLHWNIEDDLVTFHLDVRYSEGSATRMADAAFEKGEFTVDVNPDFLSKRIVTMAHKKITMEATDTLTDIARTASSYWVGVKLDDDGNNDVYKGDGATWTKDITTGGVTFKSVVLANFLTHGYSARLEWQDDQGTGTSWQYDLYIWPNGDVTPDSFQDWLSCQEIKTGTGTWTYYTAQRAQ